MPERNIVVIGASVGGVETLVQIVRGLPAGFAASILVVCHFPAGARSVLPAILSKAGKLLAVHATDGEPIRLGQIYIAPPDQHMVLGFDECIHLNRGARENHHRPAIDPLFRSAAHFGSRVIGIVLTGSLSDGTAGLLAIRAAGGSAIIQDPKDAVVAAMPQNAVDIAGADYIAPAADLPALLIKLIGKPITPAVGETSMDPIENMPAVVNEDMSEQARNQRRGELTPFTCPECGGSLWQLDQDLPRFRCHVGHAYNGETLLADQTETLEAALWSAVRGFREKAVLGRQLEALERGRGNDSAADRFQEQAVQAAEYSELIVRHVLHVHPENGWNPQR